MRYEISISDDNNYVRVKVYQAMSVKLAIEIAEEITEVGARHDLNRYLYDLRGSENVESVFANYLFVHKDLPSFDFDRFARIAIVVSVGDTSHDFIETIGRNAGYNMRVFESETQAIHWLNSEAGGETATS